MADLKPRTIFHGDSAAQHDLLVALIHNCTCETDPESGATIATCPGHAALVSDQAFIDHMEFGRYLAVRCTAEEFLE